MTTVSLPDVPLWWTGDIIRRSTTGALDVCLCRLPVPSGPYRHDSVSERATESFTVNRFVGNADSL